MALNLHNAKRYAIGFCATALLTLAGAGLFCFAAWESYDSRAWPHVPGTVVASFSERSCGGYRQLPAWGAKIVYRYFVDGRPYEANRVGSYSRIYCDSSRNDVNDWLTNNYPVGKAVEVYYDPSTPEAAFLHSGQIASLDIVMIFALLGISGLMALGAWMALRLHARRLEAAAVGAR